MARLTGAFEACIDIHYNHFLEDKNGDTLADLWRFIVSQYIKSAFIVDKQNWIGPLKMNLKKLIIYAGKITEPRFDALALNLEKTNYEHSERLKSWVFDFFLECGLSVTKTTKIYYKVITAAGDLINNFRANCLFTLVVTRILEVVYSDIQKVDNSATERENKLKLAASVMEAWRPKRKKGNSESEVKVKKQVDQRFFLACLKIQGEM